MAGGVAAPWFPPASHATSDTKPDSNRSFWDRRQVLDEAPALLRGGAAVPVSLLRGREPSGPRLGVVGHGLRTRTLEGPLSPKEPPALTEILTRRYRCRACEAVLVVVPAGVGRAVRYALFAIAWALALWAGGAAEATTRAQVSPWTVFGATAKRRWRSLSRWTAAAESLFGRAPSSAGTWRQRAARLVPWLAAQAPLPTGRLDVDAFFGAAR